MLRRLVNRVARRLSRREVHVWHSAAYRLPIPHVEVALGIEPRRADFVLWYMLDQRLIRPEWVHEPDPVRFRDMELVHPRAWLESLDRPGVLGRVMGLDAQGVPVDEVLRTFRVATQGTLEAARYALASGCATMNLLGGFHHAAPEAGGGLCVINDVAIAVAALRAEGFEGRVGVLDLDAHPPDGTAACLASDPSWWIGSLSGSDWGALPGVDETLLPRGCGDEGYLAALDALLARMPRCELVFVLAGGDVVAGDRLGMLGLTLHGARQRDLRVAAALEEAATVWLPAGGYQDRSWLVAAGTSLALTLRTERPIPLDYDPLRARYSFLRKKIDADILEGPLMTEEDMALELGMPSPRLERFMGFYSQQGIEYALYRYGVLDHLRRLGYGPFRVEFRRGDPGERLQLWGTGEGEEHLVIELALERQRLGGGEVLFIHWLTLRHPLAYFSARRPRLPGQEVPGLGIAREAVELIRVMARRLELDGIAYCPAWLHTAYPGRHDLRFVDPARQARFLALIRDLVVPGTLLEATEALSAGRVTLNGAPYRWEPDPMVHWFDRGFDEDKEAVEAAMVGLRFEAAPRG